MGATPSQFDNSFRADDFDDIIQRLATLSADPVDNKEVLQAVLTSEEWNVVSLLCRSRAISIEQLAHTRNRLQALWADGQAPRKCAASPVLFSLLCFLEAALGSTDLPSIAGRISTMEGFAEDEPDIASALRWSAKLTAATTDRALNGMRSEIARLDSDKEPLRAWLSSLLMASYVCAVLRVEAARSQQPQHQQQNTTKKKGEGGDDDDDDGMMSPDVMNSLRSLGYECLTLALNCKDHPHLSVSVVNDGASFSSSSSSANSSRKKKIASTNNNAIADSLWEILQQQELMQSLASVECKYVPPPVVEKWEDVPKAFVGQTHAINEVGDLLRAKREGLLPADKPTVLCFFGPSGHGKTELARWIARVMHHPNNRNNNNNDNNNEDSSSDDNDQRAAEDPESSKNMLILNMANYSTDSSLYSLIDPPAGVVGEGGLIRSILAQPKLVLVADEFEKSTALAINNLWLPAFESNGKLASGKDPLLKVPTKDVTFVLTCNLCDKEIIEAAAVYHRANEAGKRELRQHWSDLCGRRLCELLQNNAFLPRISRLIPFVPFTTPELNRYSSLQFEAFQRHQLARNISFFYSNMVVQRLAKGVKNFHTRSIQDAMLSPMLLAADKKADSVLVSVRTPHPLFPSGSNNDDDNVDGDGSSGSAGRRRDSKLPFIVTFIGAPEIEKIGGVHAQRIASWIRSGALKNSKEEFYRQRRQAVMAEKEEQQRKKMKQREEAEKEAAEDERRRQLQRQKETADVSQLRQDKEKEERQREQEEETARQERAERKEAQEQQHREEKEKQQTTKQHHQATSSSAGAACASASAQQTTKSQQQQQQQQQQLNLALEVEKKVDTKLQTREHIQIKELQEENLALKQKIHHLENLVTSLQQALALSCLFALSCMLVMSLFIPFKFVLLTAALAFSAGYYFITNFVDIVLAAIVGAWNLLGPKNAIGIIGGCLFYFFYIARAYSSPPCPDAVA